MPGNTNVFDYLTKVKQRSRQWRDTASLVFTVWTLVGDSTSCPGLATTGARGLSMLLRVVAFTMLILKINFFYVSKQSLLLNSLMPPSGTGRINMQTDYLIILCKKQFKDNFIKYWEKKKHRLTGFVGVTSISVLILVWGLSSKILLSQTSS